MSVHLSTKPRRRNVQHEQREQIALARYLDFRRYLWCHVPNGGHRNRITGALLKAQGAKRGVPDVLIFDAPKRIPGVVGVAIELKADGGRVLPDQKVWMAELSRRGWRCLVCFGAHEAIKLIDEIYI